MKLNVIELVSNKVWGGGERYALDLTLRLLADGQNVKVITRGIDAVDNIFRKHGVNTAHAPFKGLADFKTPKIIAKAIRALPEDEPVVIHAHDFKMGFLAVRAKQLLKKREKIKVVITRHLVKKANSNFINRFVYKNSDAIIFISETAKETFLSSNPVIETGKLHLIYNSILNSPTPKNRPFDNTKPVTILYMGRLSKEKGVELLLESLAKIKTLKWQLHIGGTGDPQYVEKLESLCRELGISDRTEWLGYVSDVWDEITKCDFGVLPTIVPEAFGLSILEFISQGIPMVVTDTGAQKEILTNGQDSIITSTDSSDFARGMEIMIKNVDLRQHLGSNAKETFRRFDYETFYNNIIHVFSGPILSSAGLK